MRYACLGKYYNTTRTPGNIRAPTTETRGLWLWMIPVNVRVGPTTSSRHERDEATNHDKIPVAQWTRLSYACILLHSATTYSNRQLVT
jgi:hypothetical protein